MMKAKQTQEAEKIMKRRTGQSDYKEEETPLQIGDCLEASKN